MQRILKPVAEGAWLITEKKISRSILEKEGIQDNGRIVRIPVYSRQGELLFTRWRDVQGKNVFIQPSGCPLYPWGLDRLNGEGPAFITEGETCRLTLLELDYTNVVAIPGAGNFKEECAEELRGHEPIYLFRDNDDAGRKGREKIAPMLAAHSEATTKLVELPPHVKDISDLWLSYWPEKEACKEKIDALLAQAEEWAPVESLAPMDDFHLTDLGNTRRLVKLYGQDLRFCHAWAKWMVWDGIRWVKDDTGEVERQAKNTVASIYAEAALAPEEAQRKAIAQHAMRSESAAKIRAMLTLAESEPRIPVTPEQLDRDPWLWNVKNGTIKGNEMMLREHRREDLITRLAPVKYDSGAECPTWRAFLDKVMAGRENLIKFLQRAVGYSLTGLTDERCLFILYGTGKNGKTTFIETIAAMMGDYAVRTPTETLLTKRSDVIPNDIARLKGARFVYASECEEGRRLAESQIKDMTGGDTLVARYLHAEFFEFKAEFKLWLSTNHKPVIKGTDEAIWDRIRLIPFVVRISEEEEIPRAKMMAMLREEWPGILAWAVRGCVEWQEKGLGFPEEIKEATASYRREMDTLAEFLDDRCLIDRTAQVTVGALYDAYLQWCEKSGEALRDRLGKKAFSQRISERGLDQYRSGDRRWWKGIGLISMDQP